MVLYIGRRILLIGRLTRPIRSKSAIVCLVSNEVFALMTQSHQYFFGYLAFWALVFLLDTGPHWENYTTVREIIETIGPQVFVQMSIAIAALKWLIPRYLNRNRKLSFFVIMAVLLLLGSELLILIRYFYIEPTYPGTYRRFLELFGEYTLQQRTISAWAFKYIFYTKFPLLLYPAAILIAFDFYTKQKRLLQISEQKKQAELTALKNQLNPHFIFNTLNNLYSLTLSKSELAPVVIEKLSDILDYMLYRCSDPFVSIQREIKLIENYIALEKIRYGERLSVELNNSVDEDRLIAPLMLLNLVENACKHSAREEIDIARVEITIKSGQQDIIIKVKNSVPSTQRTTTSDTNRIGLENLRRQLDLLYPARHNLQINNKANEFCVDLQLFNLNKNIQEARHA